MKLRSRLAIGYGIIVIICLLLLGALAHHEFWTEPRLRKLAGVPELPDDLWGDVVEVVAYSSIPGVLLVGWWLGRRTLAPMDRLTKAIERIHADNLHEPLPHDGTQDEADQLTAAFNAMTARLDGVIQQIREFTLHASHELKTPLTIMRGELETALQRPDTPQRETFESLLDEVERLARIVDGLTLLTKADAGQVQLEWEPVPLAELLQECFEDAQILAEPVSVNITLLESADLYTVGDRHRLRQLLLNLTDNAIKYNQPGGTITMALRPAGDEAEIQITNTGPGIPAELQPRVFDRFVRGADARSRGIEGCGLGLAIGQWIATAHCGTLQLTSTPGQLTTATLRLPAVK